MGPLTMTGSAFKISGYAHRPTRPPAPNLDEARTAILEELGRDPETPRERQKGPPKEGVW
jgi:hypothetical protein